MMAPGYPPLIAVLAYLPFQSTPLDLQMAHHHDHLLHSHRNIKRRMKKSCPKNLKREFAFWAGDKKRWEWICKVSNDYRNDLLLCIIQFIGGIHVDLLSLHFRGDCHFGRRISPFARFRISQPLLLRIRLWQGFQYIYWQDSCNLIDCWYAAIADIFSG